MAKTNAANKQPMTSEAPFNSEMLVLARMAREMTQGELAEAARTTQGRVSKIEHGLQEPPREVVNALARVLAYPSEFFYQRGHIHGLPLRYHRKRSQIPRKTLDRIHAEVMIRTLHVERLLRGVEAQNVREIPEIDVDEYEGAVEEIARAVRAQWQLPRGPIADLVSVLEGAGAMVIPCEFRVSEVDAIGMRLPNLPPLLFVNLSLPTDRLRFTLAHELGHLIMHRLPHPNMEEQANRFAAEFLMPAEDIRPQLYRVSLPALATLKRVWRVAMSALLVRAKNLKTITQRQFVLLWQELGRLGYRRREPAELDLAPENPSLLAGLLKFYVNTLQYDAREFCKVLAVLPALFEGWYGRLISSDHRPLQLVG